MRKSIGKAGLELIKRFEGCRLTAYRDSIGVWTIGYGHTGSIDGKAVCAGMKITLEKAEELLIFDCQRFADFVDDKSYVGFEVNENQRDALISFAYNCGEGNLRKLCGKSTAKAAAEDILNYDHAGGIRLKGLTRRRKAERDLFIKEVEEKAVEKIYNWTAEVPEYARPTIQKLLDKKYLIGNEKGELELSETMLRILVINDRAGIYD